jgi:hypothetical protein
VATSSPYQFNASVIMFLTFKRVSRMDADVMRHIGYETGRA